MATYLETKMTSLASLVREKTGATGLLSVTSMISCLLNITGQVDRTGVGAFLNRQITSLELPRQAVSIGHHAFASCHYLSALTKASGIHYASHAFSAVISGGEPNHYNSNGGTYDKGTAAPPRIPNGTGEGIPVDPVTKTSLLTATYTTFDDHMHGLASTVRAIDTTLTESLTIQDMIDHVSNITAGGVSNILAGLIDRTVETLVLTNEDFAPFGSNHQSIFSYALYGCTSLTSFVVPSCISVVDSYNLALCQSIPFFDCYASTDFQESNLRIDTCVIHGYNYSSGGTWDSVYREVITFSYDTNTLSRSDYNNTYSYMKASNTIKYTPFYWTEITSLICDAKIVDGLFSYDSDGSFRTFIHTLDLTSVSYVLAKAFAKTSQLESIIFPTNHTISIYQEAFAECTIGVVNIPPTVMMTGDIYGQNYPFNSCTRLSSAYIGIPSGSSGNKTIGGFTFCQALQMVSIYGTPTYVPDYLAYSCSNLTSLYIPDTVKYIKEQAFYGAYSLESLHFPSSLESIYHAAFAETGLTGVIDLTSTKLKKLGLSAFAGCSKITSLILPSTVNYINNDAFETCNKLNNSGSYIHVMSYNANSTTSARAGHLQRYTAGDVPGASHPYAWSGAVGVLYTTDASMDDVQDDGRRIYPSPDTDSTRYDITKAFAGAIECHFPSSVIESNGELRGCGVDYECFRFV